MTFFEMAQKKRRQEAEFLYDRYVEMMHKSGKEIVELIGNDDDLQRTFEMSERIESRSEFVDSVMELSDRALANLEATLMASEPERSVSSDRFAQRIINRITNMNRSRNIG